MRILLASVLLALVSGVGAGCQEPASSQPSSSPQPTIPQPSAAPPLLSPTIEIPPPID